MSKECNYCNSLVDMAFYETGIEQYCNCQSTLDINFDEKIWIEKYEY